VPLVKDKSGDLSSVANYRPITLSPIISKIFESVLLIKYGMYLNVNERQFGFYCNNAIFVQLELNIKKRKICAGVKFICCGKTGGAAEVMGSIA